MAANRQVFLAAGLASRKASSRALAQVHQQRGVAAVVEDHVRAFTLGALGAELEDAVV